MNDSRGFCAQALLTLTALAVCLFTGATAAGVLVPSDVIPSGGEPPAALAPGVTLQEQSSQLIATLPGVVEAQQCNERCVQQEECDWFEFCNSTDGCNTSAGLTGLAYHTCRLYDMPDCMLVPPVHERGAWIKRLVGFPLRQEAPDVPGFSTAGAQGMHGGELPECPGTVLPGKCAFAEMADAAFVCIFMQPKCSAIVVYQQGMDGCSQPVAVLTGDSPNRQNSFFAPSVYTLTKVDSRPTTEVVVVNSEGTVVVPPADSQAGGGNGTQAVGPPYQGCILVKDAVADGEVAATLDGVASAEDCCRACRARNDTVCNVWNWCPADQGGGCTAGISSTPHPPAGQLRFQDTTAPSIAWAMSLLSRNTGLPFVAGAPLDLNPQQLEPVPGYTQHLGLGTAGFSAMLSCPEVTLKPYLNICVLPYDQMADYCLSRSDCAGYAFKEGWPGPPGTSSVGMAVSTVVPANLSTFRLNPTNVLFLREDLATLQAGSDSSSSLSAGAIAGIAVAGAVVAMAAACGAAFLVRRHRRQRCMPASASSASAEKAAEEGLNAATPSPSSPSAWDAAASPQPPASQTVALSLQALKAIPVPAGWGTSASSAALQRSSASPFAVAASEPFSLEASPCGADVASAVQSVHIAGAAVDPSISSGSGLKASSASGAPSTSCSPGASSGNSAGPGSAGALLPELVQHVAACDATRRPSTSAALQQSVCAAAVSAAESGEQPVLSEDRRSSLSVLPPALRDWVVDLKDLKFLRHADGTLQELGSGASGVVHKALWHGEVIAAKSIDVGRSPGAREAFITEAMRLHQLRHAHMVALYGVALSGSTGVLLLESCAGRDLMSALPVEVAGFPGERLFGWYRRGRRIALEITKAINFLHAKSVVHMDIKSSNVLLTGMGVAKLADVGLARLQTGTFLSDLPLTGTFAWVAPEILMGGCRCTSAVDIYSLGVVLWEIVTGERPMRGQLRIPQVPEECPQDICNLILQCLSLDPSQRPTAQQAMRQLTPRSSK
ncbi:hypothetical protein ABPG75_010932 [Micractinium tetrahymenae]